MYYHYPAMYGEMGYGGFGFIGGFLHLLFWIFVIVLIVKLFKRAKHHGGWHRMWGDSAIQTLRERYAKGEINKEEYEERRKELEK